MSRMIGGDGFTAGIVIRNNSEKTIENWKLSFKYDRTITNIWNAEIISHEGNNYVIKNADYNADIMSNQEIFVGFCGIDGIYTDEIYDHYLKGSFITKNDSYNNIDSSNSDSNESKENNNEVLTNAHFDEIEIALHDLDILYQNNDSEISVTSNIGLLSEINGIPVSWLSSNVDIIDSNGNVNRPYDKSVFVELKAQLFYKSKLYTKSFSVRVIKSKYDNYCLDEIYTLDNLDQLFKYNAEPDDLDVFVKEDGRVNILVGRFSEIIVESPNEALLALNGMRKLIGMEKEDKLQYVDNYFDDEYITFNYIQLHNDIVVEGSYINITVDYDGNTIMLSNGIYTVEECISEIIDNETANQIAVNFDSKVDVIDGKLIYLIVDNYGKLTWVIKCRSENGQYHDMYIDAYSGMIVKNTQNATDNLTGIYQDEYGIFIDDVPTEVIKSEIRLVDPIRRLYILERYNISELWDSIFIDDALSYSSEG